MHKDLIKHLVISNKELVSSTGLINCHVEGLYSFVINEKPFMRLFIAGKECVLRRFMHGSDFTIPIHPHKYDDYFFKIEGHLIHHIYELVEANEELDETCFKTKAYRYPRISDGSFNPELVRQVNLRYLNPIYDIPKLKADELHTVSIIGERVSWLLVQGEKDEGFEQVCYHPNLEYNDTLYRPFDKGVEFILDYYK
jgi:hypothetical protein